MAAPTPQQVEHAERRTYADVLAGKICAAAADGLCLGMSGKTG